MTGMAWPKYVINLAANSVRIDNVRHQRDAQGVQFERRGPVPMIVMGLSPDPADPAALVAIYRRLLAQV